jgi:hypothetical protein
MAIELGLNRYISRPSSHETDKQIRERRNRERTYLVLWVHDRSLSMQTGRHWMLPEVIFVVLRCFVLKSHMLPRTNSSGILLPGTKRAETLSVQKMLS